MTREFYFEKDLVVKHLVDELEYREVEPNQFNSSLLMLKSEAIAFFMRTQEQICKNIIRNEYKGDTDRFWTELLAALSTYLYESNYNVSVQLHPKRHTGFKFLGQYSFTLYYAFDDVKKDQNQYQVVKQIAVVLGESKNNLIIKPDVALFINGFLVSTLELKLQHQNQSAKTEGRGKVVGDYREAVLKCMDLTSPHHTDTEAKKIRSERLKLFHGVIHHVAMDFSSAYVLRSLGQYLTGMERELQESRASGDATAKEILDTFLIEPTYVKREQLSSSDKMAEVLSNLYSRQALQNEVLYYNFLKYDNYSVERDGKKSVENRSNTAVLGNPRPNQKYGVDMVIANVCDKYKNENDPDYELHRLETKLKTAGLPLTKREEILNKRRAYKNNRKQYSMLLQYAAGFGKTNIICWLALQLKDLQNMSTVGSTAKDYLFDKILLLTDRVELRDQVDLAMRNMNIEKELFKEANTTAELNKYLASYSPRIIVVNIQKFPFLSDISDARKKLFAGKRVAIVIDEIHRSNSGKQHSSMTSLFDDVSDLLDGDDADKKKNLIIGLTATPTDENLIRFGEYQSCMEDIKWMPFDSYTMNEAIADGFVMDPTKAIVPYALEIIHDEVSGDDYRLPKLEEYYEDVKNYIAPVSERVSRILLSTTYKKISGRAKAMLACYSITAARRFYTELTKQIELLTQQKEFAAYRDTKVYMVYSQNQEDTPAWTICGYTNEKETISAFRKDKNGIMIVVDKLQTGFDEPRLHSLFLAKETRGINAVQTVCRVNRVFKNKEDTLVVDFSIDNRNMANIKEAFDKYAHVTVSETDTYRIKEAVETMYSKVVASEPYSLHHALYKSATPVQTIVKTQEYVDRMLLNEYGKRSLVTDAELYLNYLQKTSLIHNVIGLEDKYTEAKMMRLCSEFINLVRQRLKNKISGSESECVDFWLEKIGKIDSHELPDIEVPQKKEKDSKLKEGQVTTGFDILDQILALNEGADSKELLIEDYKTKLIHLFTKIKDQDDSSDERLVIRIRDMQYGHTDDEIRNSFQRLFRSSKRRLKREDGMSDFLDEIESNLILAESDFVEFVRK